MTDKEPGRYYFMQNRECEYFPCHRTEHPEDFNCLFCYCPLYALGRGCRGNYVIKENGIKDCTNCMIPHRRENYSYITSRYREILDLVKRIDAEDTEKKG